MYKYVYIDGIEPDLIHTYIDGLEPDLVTRRASAVFSSLSALVHLLYKATKKSTFERLYEHCIFKPQCPITTTIQSH